MFEKFSRSWSLIKSSAGVLRADKELMVFPLLSSIAAILVAISFMVPAALSGMFQGDTGGDEKNILAWLWGFGFYLAQYFVIIYFNSALVGAALIRLGGGDPTVADGFRIANGRIGVIFGYALVAATVGVVLRAVEERAGWVGSIVAGMVGLAWTLAVFLAVPVLVSQNVGPIDAVRNSAALLKKTWGENLIGSTGMGLIFGLLIVLTMMVGGVAVVAVIQTGSAPLIIAVAGVAIVIVMLMILMQAALQGIYAAAVYRFATEGNAGGSFDKAILSGAFSRKT
jgi:hypothetical protein